MNTKIEPKILRLNTWVGYDVMVGEIFFGIIHMQKDY